MLLKLLRPHEPLGLQDLGQAEAQVQGDLIIGDLDGRFFQELLVGKDLSVDA